MWALAASLAGSALPVAKKALPYALPVGGALVAFTIGWLWVGYPNGHEDGHAEGYAEGIAKGRADLAAEYVRQSIERERRNAEITRQAEREVRDEIRRLRRSDGSLDPDGLRDLCAGDPNCDPARLFGAPDPLGTELPAAGDRRYPRPQSRPEKTLPAEGN